MIKCMFGSGVFNFFYWTAYLVNSWLYKGIVIEGVSLSGDPAWGFMGAFGTGLIFFCNRQFAHNVVKSAYETEEGRIGFQMHTMLGFPGRKIEARPASISVGVPSKFGSALVPLRIDGLGKNVLIDNNGTFLENGRLLTVIATAKSAKTSGNSDKENRVKYLKFSKRQKSQNND